MYRSFTELGFLAEPGRFTSDQVAGFTSFGPTADGRVKPDLCAPGAFDWSIISAAAGSDGNGPLFELFGGTSQATPLAAGVVALIFEAFHKHHNRYPTPEETRRLLTAHADDLGYPVHMQGAGRINARRSVTKALGAGDPWTVVQVSGGTGGLARGRQRTVNARIRNDGNAPVRISARATQLVPTQGSPELVEGSVSPENPAGALTFAIHDTDLLRVAAVWPGPDLAPDADRLLVALYTPDGHFANYQRSAVTSDPEDCHMVETWVTRPIQGNWTAKVIRRPMGGNQPIPYTLKVERYRLGSWDWVVLPTEPLTVPPRGEAQLECQLRVPAGAGPDTYMGRLELQGDGLVTVVPLAVTVPARFQKGRAEFQGSFQHGRQGSWQNGDWRYVHFYVPKGAQTLLAALQWPDVENSVELYLIGPDGRPHLARTSTGDPFDRGHQLVLAEPAVGRWQMAVHSVAFSGRAEPEPFRGFIQLTDHLVEPKAVDLGITPGTRTPVAVQARNPGPVPLEVTVVGRLNRIGLQSKEVKRELRLGLNELARGGGQVDLGSLSVPSGTQLLAAYARWEPAVGELALTLYEPVAGQPRAAAFDRDGTVMVVEYHPTPGLWGLNCGITLPANVERVQVEATAIWLAPEPLSIVESNPVTVPAGGSALIPAHIALPASWEAEIEAELLVQTVAGDIVGRVPLRLRQV